MRARSAGLFESARENSSAELTRRGWLSARRAGVQTTISGATGREADDKAARGALQARRGSGGDPSSAVRTPIAPPSPPLSHLAPLSLLSTLRARACEPLPLHARASDVARAGKKVAPDLELYAAAARAASRPRQRRRGRLGRGRLIALPRRPRRWAASGGLFAAPRFASRVWQGYYVSGTSGGRRVDELPAAEGGGGGVGGLAESADGATAAARCVPRGARRSGARAAMARHTAADAPPERAPAARTAPAEPRSHGWLPHASYVLRVCRSMCLVTAHASDASRPDHIDLPTVTWCSGALAAWRRKL